MRASGKALAPRAARHQRCHAGRASATVIAPPGDDQRIGDEVGPPFVGGIDKPKHARVDEKAAVAIFGKAG
jgi:hypothetical protein